MTTPRRALTYTNQRGVAFYLHEGKTKTGKTRYFVAKSVRDGALVSMPDGYEFTESVNGVVSVRRIPDPSTVVPDADLSLVEAELRRHEHLRHHRVEGKKLEIFIHEPVGDFGAEIVEQTMKSYFISRARAEQVLEDRLSRARYAPVLKFEPMEDGTYVAHRMTYRGDGGWRLLSMGSLEELARHYIRHIGKDSFFELL